MGDGNGAVIHPGSASRGLDLATGELVGGFPLGPVIDDRGEAARLRLGDVVEPDLGTGPEILAQPPKVGHTSGSADGAIGLRRLRLIMFRPSTPTEKPMAT